MELPLRKQSPTALGRLPNNLQEGERELRSAARSINRSLSPLAKTWFPSIIYFLKKILPGRNFMSCQSAWSSRQIKEQVKTGLLLSLDSMKGLEASGAGLCDYNISILLLFSSSHLYKPDLESEVNFKGISSGSVVKACKMFVFCCFICRGIPFVPKRTIPMSLPQCSKHGMVY